MRPPFSFETCQEKERIVVNGIEFCAGDKLRLRLGERHRDTLDSLLEGLTATLEKVFLDPESKVYLAVTMDDDPAQPIQRQLGRYSFYFPDEVVLIERAEEQAVA